MCLGRAILATGQHVDSGYVQEDAVCIGGYLPLGSMLIVDLLQGMLCVLGWEGGGGGGTYHWAVC